MAALGTRRLGEMWNSYQGGAQNGVRNLTSMDDFEVFDSQGRSSKDQSFEDGVSTNMDGYTSPWAQKGLEMGLYGEEDLGKASQWIAQNGGNLYYKPGEKIDFSDFGQPGPSRNPGGPVGGGGTPPTNPNGTIDWKGGGGNPPPKTFNISGDEGEKGDSINVEPSGDVKLALTSLFNGGGFNESIVNRRADVARDQLNAQRKSQTATNKAALASRGLIGSGPEGSASENLEGRLADKFSGELSGIIADESENADSRMMTALATMAGLNTDEMQAAIDWFKVNSDDRLGQGELKLGQDDLALKDKLGTGKLDLDRLLGMGELDLGNKKADNDFTLGKGELALGNVSETNDFNLALDRLGLDRDKLLFDMENGDISQLLEVLRMLTGGAETSAGGFI
jgi:hypothetical protein